MTKWQSKGRGKESYLHSHTLINICSLHLNQPLGCGYYTAKAEVPVEEKPPWSSFIQWGWRENVDGSVANAEQRNCTYVGGLRLGYFRLQTLSRASPFSPAVQVAVAAGRHRGRWWFISWRSLCLCLSRRPTAVCIWSMSLCRLSGAVTTDSHEENHWMVLGSYWQSRTLFLMLCFAFVVWFTTFIRGEQTFWRVGRNGF